MEQFAILFNLFVTVPSGDNNVPSTVLETPPSMGDWMHLAQLGSMWAYSLALCASDGPSSYTRQIQTIGG